MKKVISRIALSFILLSVVCCGTGQTSDAKESNDGDYILIDVNGVVQGVSKDRFERDRANAIGTIFHIKKIGNNYKVTNDFDNALDALLFTPSNGRNYSCHDGHMILFFTDTGAEIQAIEGGNTMIWELEKQ